MIYRKSIETTEALAAWYNAKYASMGGTWVTPPSDANLHLDQAGLTQGTRLLDVGAGGGHFLSEAKKRVEVAVGVEICQLAVTLARQFSGCPVFPYSIEATPFQGEMFDYVFSIGSLEHVINIEAALDEIHRLLTPQGVWYFYLPNELWRHEDQCNERCATEAEWREMFRQHRLVTRKVYNMGDNSALTGVKA